MKYNHQRWPVQPPQISDNNLHHNSMQKRHKLLKKQQQQNAGNEVFDMFKISSLLKSGDLNVEPKVTPSTSGLYLERLTVKLLDSI